MYKPGLSRLNFGSMISGVLKPEMPSSDGMASIAVAFIPADSETLALSIANTSTVVGTGGQHDIDCHH